MFPKTSWNLRPPQLILFINLYFQIFTRLFFQHLLFAVGGLGLDKPSTVYYSSTIGSPCNGVIRDEEDDLPVIEKKRTQQERQPSLKRQEGHFLMACIAITVFLGYC